MYLRLYSMPLNVSMRLLPVRMQDRPPAAPSRFPWSLIDNRGMSQVELYDSIRRGGENLRSQLLYSLMEAGRVIAARRTTGGILFLFQVVESSVASSHSPVLERDPGTRDETCPLICLLISESKFHTRK